MATPLTVGAAIGTIAAAAALSSAVAAASGPSAQATTHSYVFRVSVGMPEHMWTMAQVKAKHPKSGEVMLMGVMVSGGSMSMGSQRHLEVHITSRATGKVVTNAVPTITVVDPAAMNAMAQKVGVAEMRGVSKGASDIHYGNNVTMKGGHLYSVTVALHGEHATVKVTAPK
jgi:hypothetical protein